LATPVLGRNAVVKKDGVEIGYATGVTVSIDVDLIKEYQIGSDAPAIVAPGTKTYSVSIDKMFIDNAWAEQVKAGTEVSLEIAPAGATTGKPKITLNGVIFTGWEISIDAEGVIMESVEGEAKEIVFGTY